VSLRFEASMLSIRLATNASLVIAMSLIFPVMREVAASAGARIPRRLLGRGAVGGNRLGARPSGQVRRSPEELMAGRLGARAQKAKVWPVQGRTHRALPP